MAEWVHALRFVVTSIGKYRFDRDYKTSPAAINCRAGTKAVLESLGYRLENTKGIPGSACSKIVIDPVFDPFRDREQKSIEILYAERDDLIVQLPYPTAKPMPAGF